MQLDDYLKQRGASARLARELGVTPSFIYQIRKKHRRVPVALCARIERATFGAVTRMELRDKDWQTIWPELVAMG